MLNTDSIRDKILGDARKSAAQLLSDADVRAQNARMASEQRVRDAQKKAMDDAEAQGEEMRDRMLRMAELDMRKSLLAAKREVIDEAFEKALEKMRAMDISTAREFIKAQLLDSASGTETIVISAGDERIFTPEFIEDVNGRLKAAGRQGALKLDDERRELGGGFILKDGGAEIMCTYEALMGEARTALEGDVLRLLFPEV
ncbi:MAG: V-type ATP synthase subunit E [Candidatus Fimadaptatus sp.]